MKEYYKFLITFFNYGTPSGEHLFETAKKWLGKDVAPIENEYGCAESVNNIVYKAFGDYAGGDLSTYRMYNSIKNNKLFAKVKSPLPGDIILSPTGYGNRRKLSNGHVGIVGDNGYIMSNDSKTGLWSGNYTLNSWKSRYQDMGEYPIHYFRRIFKS